MLKDKVIILSGGTSGIGHAIAISLARQGATVYACARHPRTFE